MDAQAVAARVDAEVQRALAELETVAVPIDGAERRRLFDDIRADTREALAPLGQRFEEAKRLLEERIGVRAGLRALWSGGDDYLRGQVERALSDAKTEDALARMRTDLDAAVERRAAELYDEHRQRFADVLRRLIERTALPRATQELLLSELFQQVSDEITARAHARGEPVVDAPFDAPVGTAVGAAAFTATRTVVRQRLTQQIGARVGTSFVARAIGGRAAALLAPGIGVPLFIGGTVYDLLSLSGNATEAAMAAVDKVFNQTRTAFTDQQAIQPLADTVVASIEGLLQRDLEGTRPILFNNYENVLRQARSPGIEVVTANLPPDAVYRLLKNVAFAFGDAHADVDIRLKRQIVEGIGTVTTRTVTDRYGSRFLELYGSYPEAVGRMLAHGAGLGLFEVVMAAPDQAAEIDVMDRFLVRDPEVSEARVRSFVLVRALLPDRALDAITPDALSAIEPVLQPVERLRGSHPATARSLVEAVLAGEVGPEALSTLGTTRRLAESNALASVMVGLGGERYVGLVAEQGPERLLSFLADFPDGRGLTMLGNDPGYLDVHADPRLGKTAVEVRERLAEENGPLTAEQDQSFAWAFEHRSIPRDRITNTLIDDLVAMDIPAGSWPNFLAEWLGRGLTRVSLATAVPTVSAIVLLLVVFKCWRLVRRLSRRRRKRSAGGNAGVTPLDARASEVRP